MIKKLALFLMLGFSFNLLMSQDDPGIDPTPTVDTPASSKRDALLLYQQKKYAEAVEVCREELASSPERQSAYIVMGWSQLKGGWYTDAYATAERGLTYHPGNSSLLEIRGEASFSLGNLFGALYDLQAYISLFPSGDRVPEAYYLIGDALLQLKEYHKADIALSTAVYYYPDSSLWHTRLGMARELAKDYDNSLKAYETALSLDPGDEELTASIQRIKGLLGQ